MGLIEWRKLQASNGDSYYGYYKGLQVGYIMDVAGKEYIASVDNGSEKTYHKTLEEAKAKAEELFTEWLKSAGLVQRPESCGKCGDSGTKKMWPPVGRKALMTCHCTKDPNSLYSFIKEIKGG